MFKRRIQRFIATPSTIIVLCLFCFQTGSAEYMQEPANLIEGEVMALAYSGFRDGQHPDRGEGAINPSEEEVLEDLNIMVDRGFRLIRLYDSGVNSAMVIRLIEENKLDLKVLLGIWLDAEVSNHEGCPWLKEPITPEKLALNRRHNVKEIVRAVDLARDYEDIVVAVNVGNEVLVEWNDHMVTLESMIEYVKRIQELVDQPITVADNYLWWVNHGAPLAEELDFIGVHTYPVWENKTIDEALAFTIQNILDVHAAIPEKPIAILEAGWPTTSVEFPDEANEINQKRYYKELSDWATETNTTIFFFEAFDEAWKGDPNNLKGAEKHWGLFFSNRKPKLIFETAPEN